MSAYSMASTFSQVAPITHWCRQCDSHHPMHRVSHAFPCPTNARGKKEVWVCPSCNSYDIEELLEVSDAK
jgi:hypothetical protein